MIIIINLGGNRAGLTKMIIFAEINTIIVKAVEIWLDTKKIDLLIFFIGFFHKMNDSTPLYPTEHSIITRKKCVLVSVTVFILIIMMTLIAVTSFRSVNPQTRVLSWKLIMKH